MSWSVSSSGLPGAVIEDIHKQLWAGPLADKPAGLSDDGERETVEHISETINQCLEAFDPERSVSVSANGHIGFTDWDKKTGANQSVNLSIQPL